MKPSDADGWLAEDGPADDLDLQILDRVREAFAEADPMPADLPVRIRFSLALRDLEVEVARLAEEDRQLLAARGTEQSRTVTFDSDSLTIMIRIDSNEDGTVRIDGWIAPPQCREIELKTTAQSLRVLSDEQGRFAFGSVPRGSAQLTARLTEQRPSGSGRAVVTPALIL
jgi:alkanesulfonate monooxygenase SsuD/methylene tetrahydromethanopterin reductase-like flavin-dependent oxidoreductase (luciferase family)